MVYVDNHYKLLSKKHYKMIKSNWKIVFFSEKKLKNVIFHLFLILKSWLRAALDPLEGRMQPAGRVFEVPDLDVVCQEFTNSSWKIQANFSTFRFLLI